MDININSAKDYFMEMMEEVERGREYFILKHGKPVARIVPVVEGAPARAEITERLFSYQTLT
jgi:prevent-host-death family protein